MIIVRLLSPERSWLVVSHQSLLGHRSPHCHGTNFTHCPPPVQGKGVLSVIAILRQLTVFPCAVALAITAHQDVTFLTDRTRFICVYISAFAFYYQLLAGL